MKNTEFCFQEKFAYEKNFLLHSCFEKVFILDSCGESSPSFGTACCIILIEVFPIYPLCIESISGKIIFQCLNEFFINDHFVRMIGSN